MPQVVARLDDGLLSKVDDLVARGVVANRSEAVRIALEQLVDEQRRKQIGSDIVRGYQRIPQTPDELRGLDRATRALVQEEPW